ncbi:MAG: DUF2505 family protein [Deltaproteobacteria bacterium]|nr:DUF2505 family protein [Deltaproteobacteria bacterium]
MLFEIDHEIEAPLESFEAALLWPDLAQQLGRSFAAMASLEPLVHDLDDRRLVRVWRFQAHAPLGVLQRFEAASEWLGWEERVEYDRAAHRAHWQIVPRGEDEPDAPWRRYFSATGSYELIPLGEGRTRRRVSGELSVRIPVLGRLVERAAMGKLRRAYASEADIVLACCAV